MKKQLFKDQRINLLPKLSDNEKSLDTLFFQGGKLLVAAVLMGALALSPMACKDDAGSPYQAPIAAPLVELRAVAQRTANSV